jgi:DUF1009 family protein
MSHSEYRLTEWNDKNIDAELDEKAEKILKERMKKVKIEKEKEIEKEKQKKKEEGVVLLGHCYVRYVFESLIHFMILQSGLFQLILYLLHNFEFTRFRIMDGAISNFSWKIVMLVYLFHASVP